MIDKRMCRILKRLAKAAEVYCADQSYAEDPRCGLVQPITVEEGLELNRAVNQAYGYLEEIKWMED